MYNISDDFDPDQAYGYGDFVSLPDGRRGMIINCFPNGYDSRYNITLWGTFEVVYSVPQNELTLDEDELVEVES